MNNKYFKVIIGIIVTIVMLYLFTYIRYHNKSFILLYHRVESYKGGHKSLYVNPENFDRQMKFLYSRGYKTITLTELRDMILKKDIKPKTFCITFDDGYKNNYEFAYPILKKYGFTATVFVVIEAIGKKFSYPGMQESEHMNIKELKIISDIFCIGSHSVSHNDMSTMDKQKILSELTESKKYLENKVGIKIENYAVPFGKYFDNYSVLLSTAGYVTSCSTKNGLIDTNVDVYCLPRIEWKELKSMSPKDFFKNLDFYLKIFLGL